MPKGKKKADAPKEAPKKAVKKDADDRSVVGGGINGKLDCVTD